MTDRLLLQAALLWGVLALPQTVMALGSDDVFIAKYDLNNPGNDPIWVEQNGTSGWEQGAKIMMGYNLIKYIAGDTAGELMLVKVAECNSFGL